MFKNEYSNLGMQQYEKIGQILICVINLAVMADNSDIYQYYIYFTIILTPLGE